eukprot:CAMPEP_0171258516 /NCGR_PEP_ID=MMETSP0790-20130122/54428_1 /TAXON_ID=2925 /ORGANISM="Alexandrium catenella, Strain OF101" /LENGTH=462 /DNA_ID=CAMNT_0011726713 /DNA_START=252 /DNA_END=1638 /DNA_ORIENTATION=+
MPLSSDVCTTAKKPNSQSDRKGNAQNAARGHMRRTLTILSNGNARELQENTEDRHLDDLNNECHTFDTSGGRRAMLDHQARGPLPCLTPAPQRPRPSELRDLRRGAAEACDGTGDHLGHDLGARLDLVDCARRLADEQRLHLTDLHVHALLLLLLHVVEHRCDSLAGQRLDVGSAVVLPVHDVIVLDDPHGPAGEDDRADGVMVARLHGALLVARRRPRLFGGHEARANPHGAGTEAQCTCQATAIEDAASGDHHDGAASERGGLAAAEVDNLGHKDGSGHVAGVAAALATLGADQVAASVDGVLRVLRRTDHVHHRDARCMKLVHGPLGRHAHRRDEQLCATADDDVNELGQCTVSVVVISLAGALANLGQQQIDAEGGVLVLQASLQLVNVGLQHLWCVANAADDAEAPVVRHGRGELWACGNVHPCEDDRVLDAKELRDRGGDGLRQARHAWKELGAQG